MKSMIRFSMKNTAAVLLLVALLVGGGLFAVQNMKMEKYPDIDIPYLHVGIVYPGASPEQVMRDIADRLEPSFGNIEGVVGVYSFGNPNGYHAVLKATMSVPMDKIEEEARKAVAEADLPEGTQAPTYFTERLDPELYIVAYSGEDQAAVQQFAEQSVVPAFRQVEGIDSVDVNGSLQHKIYIDARPEALAAQGLTLDQLQQLIAAHNLSIPIGDIRSDSETLPLRIDESFGSAEAIADLRLPAAPSPEAVAAAGGALPTFRLGDIADVSYEARYPEISRINGQPAVTVSVTADGGEDAVGIVEELKAKAAKLPLPAGVKEDVLLDQSGDIEHSVNGMLREVLLGALMAVVVTLLFLRNLRSTIIAVISIPLSMFASFIVLNQLGYTLNMMTLAGIAVAIGRVVDDSIVVIENVFRRVRGVRERDAALVEEATREVASAITSSTLTTVAVFLPLAFVPGIVGKFFVPLAWTVVVSLLFSLLVAVTVVPLLSRLFLLKTKHAEPKDTALQRTYRGTLQWVLRRRLATLGLAVLLLLGSAAVPALGLIGFNFLPAEKPTNFNINVEMPIGTNTAAAERVASRIETAVEAEEDVNRIYTRAWEGGAQVAFRVDEDTDTDALGERLREKFDGAEGADSITLVGLGGIGGSNYLNIIVNGPDREAIAAGAGMIAEALKPIDGLADVRNSAEGEKPEIAIDFDPEALAGNGLTPAEVALKLRAMVEGDTIGQTEIDGRRTDIVLTLAAGTVRDIAALEEQMVANQLGQAVKLSALGSVERVLGPTAVNRLDGNEYLEVLATITDENTSKVTSEAFAAIDALDLPDGVTWTSEGAATEMNEGFVNMGIALAVSVILVYFVMLLAFGEAVMPLVILAAIPFSITGAMLGLAAVGEPIGMPAMIGLLMLNGIVVTNAIVLLDRVKKNERSGMERREALIEAGVTRVRPILMTAVATMGALLPLALSTEAGLVSRALAVVVIGGLASSTLLTLLIVPAIYSILKPVRKAAKKENALAA